MNEYQELPGAPTPAMRQYLNETKPWVRLVSVLMFIGTAFLFLVGGLALAAGVAGSVMGPASDMGFGAFGLILGILYPAIGIAYLIPALFLHRYAGAIARMQAGDGVAAMEEALKQQRSFWRFIGIVTLAMVILSVVFMVLGAVMGLLIGAGGIRA